MSKDREPTIAVHLTRRELQRAMFSEEIVSDPDEAGEDGRIFYDKLVDAEAAIATDWDLKSSGGQAQVLTQPTHLTLDEASYILHALNKHAADRKETPSQNLAEWERGAIAKISAVEGHLYRAQQQTQPLTKQEQKTARDAPKAEQAPEHQKQNLVQRARNALRM